MPPGRAMRAMLGSVLACSRRYVKPSTLGQSASSVHHTNTGVLRCRLQCVACVVRPAPCKHACRACTGQARLPHNAISGADLMADGRSSPWLPHAACWPSCGQVGSSRCTRRLLMMRSAVCQPIRWQIAAAQQRSFAGRWVPALGPGSGPHPHAAVHRAHRGASAGGRAADGKAAN